MRLYDGCPDSALKAKWAEDDRIRNKIYKLGYSVTWFPMEACYMAFKKYQPASNFHTTLQGVLYELQNQRKE